MGASALRPRPSSRWANTIRAIRGTARVPSPWEGGSHGRTHVVRADRVHRPFRHPDGAIQELRAGVERLVGFIDEREPQLLAYGFYIDEDAGTMTVVAVHPDQASLEIHLAVGGEEFRKLAHLLTLTSIECYGRPSDRALEQLRQKAATLGDGGTIVSIGRYAGFTHLAPTDT